MEQRKFDVFISYKRQSLNIVKAIVHILENEGIKCWYDSSLDENAGKDYSDIIAKNIRESRMLIAVLSNAALESEWVKSEVKLALEQKKHVIPFVVAELQINNGLTMLLNGKHWINAYPNPDRKFALLLRNVKLALNELVSKEEGNISEESQLFNVAEDFSTDFDFDEGEALYQAKEYGEAALAFIASAERGNEKAKDRLCQMFYDQEKDIPAFDEEMWAGIEQQARNGHCYANFLMHCKLYKDASNNLVAFEYLKKAVSKSSIPLAFLRLGIQYNWGMGIKQSHTLAMHYYNKALNMGCKEAYSYIAQEYAYGNDKTKVNFDKAIQLLKKGIEAGDKRSYEQLFNLYFYNLKQKDKAEEIARKAIDMGDGKGYALMGKIALGDKEDTDEAIRWYKKALLHDEKKAYGMLAWLYDSIHESETAILMAKKGRLERDPSSFTFLGYKYEEDGDYDNAWQCYKEEYDFFGTGADSLSRLVIEKGFKPKEIESDKDKELFLDQLEQMVEIQARNSNQECLNALLKLYSYRETGNYKIDYSICQRLPKAFEIIRLGAEMGLSEMMYYLGKCMMDESTPKHYNPLKGIEWIGKAVDQGYASAISELLEIYQNGIWKDDEAFQKLVIYAISNHSLQNEKLIKDLEQIKNIDKDNIETILSFIENVFHNEPNIEIKVQAAAFLLIKKDQLNYQLNDVVQNDIRMMANDIMTQGDYGYLRKIGKDLLLCYPEYNWEKGFDDFFHDDNSLNAHLFYALSDNSYISSEKNITKHDDTLRNLYKKVQNEKSYKRFIIDGESNCLVVYNDWLKAINNFNDSYQIVCKNLHLTPYCNIVPKYSCCIPYVSSKLAVTIWRNILKSLYVLLPHVPIIKKIFDEGKTQEEILDIAEKQVNVDLQLMLIEFVEIAMETDKILDDNNTTWQHYVKKEDDAIVVTINKFVELVNTSGLDYKLELYTQDDIRQLHSIDYESENKRFEIQLEDFINREFKD